MSNKMRLIVCKKWKQTIYYSGLETHNLQRGGRLQTPESDKNAIDCV